MSKTSRKLTSFLIIILTLQSISLFITPPFGAAQNGTNASGKITQDTTWTKANSPYNLAVNITVNNGVTLTVEPGTTVNLFGYYVEVNGALVAKGTSESMISFSGLSNNTIYFGGIIFTSQSANWNERTTTGCILENCDLLSVRSVSISNSSPRISSNLFHATSLSGVVDPMLKIYGGSPIIFNNTFTSNIFPYRYLSGGTAILLDDNNATIVDNTIEQNMIGICFSGVMKTFTGKTIVENNLLFNNSEAIFFGAPLTSIVENNTIAQNFRAARIYRYSDNSVFAYNNIYSNTNASIILQGEPNDINATYNWWGTTDSQAISQSIHDFKNDSTLGVVNFAPILNAPNPKAMPDPNAYIPTLSPTPTPSPSPTSASSSPTSTPAPTLVSSSPNITSTPTSNVPEFPVMVILLLFATIFLIVTAVLRKNLFPKAYN
jgi:hypothetical protein